MYNGALDANVSSARYRHSHKVESFPRSDADAAPSQLRAKIPVPTSITGSEPLPAHPSGVRIMHPLQLPAAGHPVRVRAKVGLAKSVPGRTHSIPRWYRHLRISQQGQGRQRRGPACRFRAGPRAPFYYFRMVIGYQAAA